MPGEEILGKLKVLTRAQFNELLYRLDLNSSDFLPDNNETTSRAVQLLEFWKGRPAEQLEAALTTVLAGPTSTVPIGMSTGKGDQAAIALKSDEQRSEPAAVRATGIASNVIVTIVWFVLVAVFIDSRPIHASGIYISSIRDIIGHWLTVFCLLTTIVLHQLRKTAIHYLEAANVGIDKKLNRYYIKFRVSSFLACTCMGTFNVFYVTHGSGHVQHWTQFVCPWVLPAFVAALFFLAGLFPLLVSVLEFALILNVITQHADKLGNFGPDNRDPCFGPDSPTAR